MIQGKASYLLTAITVLQGIGTEKDDAVGIIEKMKKKEESE